MKVKPKSAIASERLDALFNSVATRLRAVKQWENADGDEYRMVWDALRSLETQARPNHVCPNVRRPLKSWDDADAVLENIIHHPWHVETSWRVTVDSRALIWMSRQFWEWRKAGEKAPSNVRVMSYGDLCVEWTKGNLILSLGYPHVTGTIPPITVMKEAAIQATPPLVKPKADEETAEDESLFSHPPTKGRP